MQKMLMLLAQMEVLVQMILLTCIILLKCIITQSQRASIFALLQQFSKRILAQNNIGLSPGKTKKSIKQVNGQT